MSGSWCFPAHWEDIDDLRAQYPELEVKENQPFVDTGRVVTSAGIPPTSV